MMEMDVAAFECRVVSELDRLPDDMVAFLDKSVAAGNAPSRAALVARALEREMRRNVVKKIKTLLSEHYLKEVSIRYL